MECTVASAPLASRTCRSLAALLALAAGLSVADASAQGLFDFLFGGDRDRYPARNLPPQTSSFADPFGLNPAPRRDPGISTNTGRAVSYCVRLCDGRYFPIQRHASASPAQLCSSFCPAAKTAVFNGSAIDHAVAPNGARYADLDNAFVYRDKIVADCTCNGRDAFGLARIDVASDPTLRPGDIVATAEGLQSYNGGRGNRTAGNFTPVKNLGLRVDTTVRTVVSDAPQD
jgi:uncharacterized protein DUF2865